ncbi:MAG: hypothetical protein WBM13_13435 [Bacteroidia bacterium]
MKFIKLVLFGILLFVHTCFAQKDSISKKQKTFLGVASGNIMGWDISNAYYTHFTMQKGQSLFSIGPVFGNRKNLQYAKHDWYYYDNSLSVNGLSAICQIYAHPEKKTFQWYFMNELLFRYYSDKGRTQFIYSDIGYDVYLPAAINYNFHQSSIGAYLGFGLRVNFLKNFYCTSNIVVGLSYLTTVQKYENNTYNDKFDYYDYNLFLKAGLGYKFDYNNKKPKRRKDTEFTDSMFMADFGFINLDTSKHKTVKPQIKEKHQTIDLPSKAIWGVNTGIQPIFEAGTTTQYTNLTFQKSRNEFEFGLLMGEKNLSFYGSIAVEPKKYGLKGINLVYQRISKPHSQRFQFYFQNLLCYSYSYFNGRAYLPHGYYPITKSYHADQTILSNHLSYGCKIKFLKNFYFDQSFGLGFVAEFRKVNYENYYISKNTEGYLGVLLKLGVGYTFNKK